MALDSSGNRPSRAFRHAKGKASSSCGQGTEDKQPTNPGLGERLWSSAQSMARAATLGAVPDDLSRVVSGDGKALPSTSRALEPQGNGTIDNNSRGLDHLYSTQIAAGHGTSPSAVPIPNHTQTLPDTTSISHPLSTWPEGHEVVANGRSASSVNIASLGSSKHGTTRSWSGTGGADESPPLAPLTNAATATLSGGDDAARMSLLDGMAVASFLNTDAAIFPDVTEAPSMEGKFGSEGREMTGASSSSSRSSSISNDDSGPETPTITAMVDPVRYIESDNYISDLYHHRNQYPQHWHHRSEAILHEEWALNQQWADAWFGHAFDVTFNNHTSSKQPNDSLSPVDFGLFRSRM